MNKLAFFLAMGKIFSLIINMIIPITLVRLISKEEYGLFMQFTMLYMFLATTFGFGIRSNLVYFYNSVEYNFRKCVLLHTFTTLSIISLTLFLSSLLLSRFYVEIGLGDTSREYITLLFFCASLQMISNVTDSLYIAKEDRTTALLFPICTVLIKGTAVLIFAFYYRSIDYLVYSILISTMITTIVSLLYIRKEYITLRSGKLFDKTVFLQQIKYSVPFGLANSLREIMTRFDKIIAIKVLNPSAYAGYIIAFTAIPGISAIYDSLAQVTMIKMTRAVHEKCKKTLLSSYHELVKKGFSFGLPLVLVIMYYADYLVPLLYTAEYKESVLLFQVYLPAILFMITGSDLMIRVSGKTEKSFICQVKSSAISIPATFFMLYEYGALGGVIASLLSVVLQHMLLLYEGSKIYNIKLIEIFPWKDIFKILSISIIALYVSKIIISICNMTSSFTEFMVVIVLYGGIVIVSEIYCNCFILDRKYVVCLIRSKYMKLKV